MQLTMNEIKDILQSCLDDDIIKNYFKKFQIFEISKISPEWRNYLNYHKWTIEEYNDKVEELNEMSLKVAQDLMNKALKRKTPKKIINYIIRLSKKFGDELNKIYGEPDALIGMNDENFLRLKHANHFTIMLGLEQNSRNMGFKNYKDLCEYRMCMY
jgi:hypothetical protein